MSIQFELLQLLEGKDYTFGKLFLLLHKRYHLLQLAGTAISFNEFEYKLINLLISRVYLNCPEKILQSTFFIFRCKQSTPYIIVCILMVGVKLYGFAKDLSCILHIFFLI